MRTLAPAVLVAVLAVLSARCGRPVDLKQVLQVSDLSGGYHDAGIVDGRNKIVPTVSFRLKKSTNDDIRPLSLNVVFKKLPKAGYTGDPPQSRADILTHSMFQDVRAHIFAKHSATQWVEIGSFDIPRQILAR